MSIPVRSLTFYTGDMVDFSTEGVWGTFDAIARIVEEAQVIVHKANQPNVISDFAHADVLTGEHATEIDLAPAEAQTPTLGHGDSHIVERVMQLR
jgi:hypothetical protein